MESGFSAFVNYSTKPVRLIHSLVVVGGVWCVVVWFDVVAGCLKQVITNLTCENENERRKTTAVVILLESS